MKFWSMKPKPTLLSKNIIFIKLKITPSPIYFDFPQVNAIYSWSKHF